MSAQKKELSVSDKVPRTLVAYFQEYDFNQIDPAQHADLIIERVLAYGDRNELRWLFRRYDREQVIAWVVRLGAGGYPGDVTTSGAYF